MVIKGVEYSVLAFFFTTLLASTQNEYGILPQLVLAQWGPGIVGIVMLLLYRKEKLSLKFEFKRDESKDYLLSIVNPIIITGIAIILLVVTQEEFGLSQLSFLASIVTIASALFGVIVEEIGWRGYLQPVLASAYSRLSPRDRFTHDPTPTAARDPFHPRRRPDGIPECDPAGPRPLCHRQRRP
jgi:membrane protease YdiL (CAAX protease family)